MYHQQVAVIRIVAQVLFFVFLFFPPAINKHGSMFNLRRLTSDIRQFGFFFFRCVHRQNKGFAGKEMHPQLLLNLGSYLNYLHFGMQQLFQSHRGLFSITAVFGARQWLKLHTNNKCWALDETGNAAGEEYLHAQVAHGKICG